MSEDGNTTRVAYNLLANLQERIIHTDQGSVVLGGDNTQSSANTGTHQYTSYREPQYDPVGFVVQNETQTSNINTGVYHLALHQSNTKLTLHYLFPN